MPDLHSSDIDIRNYVQVKKLRDGCARDSRVVPGVVLTKNVAHRAMPQKIENPTVLLLDCSIAYQRVEGKLTSLEPVLLQEQEYLVRCAARITALHPDVVLVRGAAARAVQDALRAAGVALATAVGRGALHRAARCLRADLVASVDARIAVPRLGHCRQFSVTCHPSKTLMSLEGCAEPQLGCCILICGAPLSELARVKKVVKFMLLACYNWKLEKAFLADIEVVLPEPGMTWDDDGDDDDNNINKMLDDEVKQEGNKDEKVDKVSVATEALDTDDDKDVDSLKKDDSSSFNDPLTSKFVRKADSDRLSCGVPIRDFSDPLRATVSVEDDVFLPTEESLKADNHTDRWSIDDTILSMSPNIIIPPPYLETEAGRRCPLRKYFPVPLLRPPPRAPHTPRVRRVSRPRQSVDAVQVLHPFIATPITGTADEPALRGALANYRATGGCTNSRHKPECPQNKPSVVKKVPKDPELEEKPEPRELDPLAPDNHQKLVVLLYSYSSKSANSPDFCVNPWIVTMEMYGRHDITLGAFLAKYCFNGEYKCPSNNCSVPVNQHVRRFVHGDACITITSRVIQHSMEKVKEEQENQVLFWSRCEQCGARHRARRLSRAALSLSLAVYLRARSSPARALRSRACRHAHHAHAHVFATPTAAYYRYTITEMRFMKITPYEIELPPEVISIKYDTKVMRDELINQLNDLMLKGHETFSSVTETEAEKDYQAFKHHTEQIHVSLTTVSLQENSDRAAVVRSLWNVSDRIILGEKMLRDAQEKWASPAPKNKPPPDTPVEDKSDFEESSGEAIENSEPSKDEKEHAGTEEDEEKGDKKTVRQILSQLLSNKESSNQSGMIISSGLVPVVVMAGEIGSVIAATLASVTYQRSLRAQRHSNQTEQEEGEPNTGKDKTDGDKNKAAKSNEHIEVLLKDALICRVYYASQFHKLRHMLLAPLGANPHIADAFAAAPAPASASAPAPAPA
ncbi:putative 1-phosphatidylinositol 3-phosphate 5-kinase, partial [Choristoneura fumiferana]|uniref:putative 1-phosphatidylinositol 3-phosphate 5-kinase n=1 Tax=Choristoneura fumiferana TaxID=7141 RepID=UPI003D15E2D7